MGDARRSVLLVYPGNFSRDIHAQIVLVNRRFRLPVHFCSFVRRGPLHDVAEEWGGRSASLAEGGAGQVSVTSPSVYGRLQDFVRNVGATHVLCHTQRANLLGAVLGRVYGGRVWLVRHHADYVHKGYNRKAKAADRFINLLGRHHVAVSEAVLRQMLRVENVSSGKVTRMDLGFLFQDFPFPDPLSVGRIRSRFRGKKIVLGVGRFIECKRFELFVDAAAMVLGKKDDVVFLLLGDGPLRERLELRAKRVGLSPDSFLGQVANIQDYYAASDLLVHPSSSEASSNTLKEALFYALPILTCRSVGDVESYVLREGYLLPKDLSARFLAERILRALWGPEPLTEPTALDRKRMMDRFDIERQTPFWAQFLDVPASEAPRYLGGSTGTVF